MVARERCPSQRDASSTAEGRIELLYCLREQAVTRTTHRYGNVL